MGRIGDVMMATATLEPAVESEIVLGDKPHDEVIGGGRGEAPRVGSYETQIASILHGLLFPYGRDHGIGQAVSEMLFRLDESGDEKRRPDLAFVSYARWPKGKRSAPKDGWAVVPDLAVEVVSDSNTA